MKIGDKVVCIDDSPSKCPCCLGKDTGLVKNQVYVIQNFEIDSRKNLSLALIGIQPKCHSFSDLKGFLSIRFRPLEDIKEIAAAKNSTTQTEVAETWPTGWREQ
jgi:hypothetical protein